MNEYTKNTRFVIRVVLASWGFVFVFFNVHVIYLKHAYEGHFRCVYSVFIFTWHTYFYMQRQWIVTSELLQIRNLSKVDKNSAFCVRQMSLRLEGVAGFSHVSSICSFLKIYSAFVRWNDTHPLFSSNARRTERDRTRERILCLLLCHLYKSVRERSACEQSCVVDTAHSCLLISFKEKDFFTISPSVRPRDCILRVAEVIFLTLGLFSGQNQTDTESFIPIIPQQIANLLTIPSFIYTVHFYIFNSFLYPFMVFFLLKNYSTKRWLISRNIKRDTGYFCLRSVTLKLVTWNFLVRNLGRCSQTWV